MPRWRTDASGTKGITWHRFRERAGRRVERLLRAARPGDAAKIAAALIEDFERPAADGGVEDIDR